MRASRSSKKWPRGDLTTLPGMPPQAWWAGFLFSDNRLVLAYGGTDRRAGQARLLCADALLSEPPSALAAAPRLGQPRPSRKVQYLDTPATAVPWHPRLRLCSMDSCARLRKGVRAAKETARCCTTCPPSFCSPCLGPQLSLRAAARPRTQVETPGSHPLPTPSHRQLRRCGSGGCVFLHTNAHMAQGPRCAPLRARGTALSP